MTRREMSKKMVLLNVGSMLSELGYHVGKVSCDNPEYNRLEIQFEDNNIAEGHIISVWAEVKEGKLAVTDGEILQFDGEEELSEDVLLRIQDRISTELELLSKKENFKLYDLGMGHMGNGLTIWNRAEERYGDYVTVAHISADRKVTYREELPKEIQVYIEYVALTDECYVSQTQKYSIYNTKPIQRHNLQFEQIPVAY